MSDLGDTKRCEQCHKQHDRGHACLPCVPGEVALKLRDERDEARVEVERLRHIIKLASDALDEA